MKAVWTIFRKELIDSLRDRRTIMAMIVVPLLMFPLLMGISSRMMISQMKKAQEKVLKVGLLTHGNAESFRKGLLEKKDITVVESLSSDSGQALVRSDSLNAFILFAEDFDRQVARLQAGGVVVFVKVAEESGSEIEKERVLALLRDFERDLQASRFRKMGYDETIVKTIDLREENLASAKEKLAQVIGGFLPYLFIIFCFMGSMYPAIDLASGEKERGTLETLLTSPVTHFQVLLGKFGVVVLTGLVSAAVSIFGLYIGVRQAHDIPPEFITLVLSILEWKTIVLVLSLLAPLTVFFAAVLLSLSIMAKTFKEAQSIISPLTIVVIVPAFIGLMPGMALNSRTALIPILNVSLATKAIIAGNATVPLMLEVYLSLIVLAVLSLWICSMLFRRESVLFR
jgi:sodium transport system permease protein